jgi:hypothetical protein
MRDNGGRKLDHTTLEQLRIRTVRQIQQGASSRGRRGGAWDDTGGAVYAWLAKYGKAGWRRSKRARFLGVHRS